MNKKSSNEKGLCCNPGMILLLVMIPFTSFQSLPANRTQSSIALAYFNQAFKIIRSNSYKRKEFNFKQLYQQALPLLKDAVSTRDAYPAIKLVLAQLNDRHSVFTEPQTEISIDSSTNYPNNPFLLRSTAAGYLTLELFSYSSPDKVHQKLIADNLYRSLKQAISDSTHGLVIDLRRMEGGSVNPFLCALGAIIGTNPLLGFRNGYGEKILYTFNTGVLWRNYKRSKFQELYLNDYTPLLPRNLLIAIVIGPYTASAGELIAIAFKGVPNSKSFGSPSLGVPTGVAEYKLSDGARIQLATSVPFDRLNITYISSLAPDIPIDLLQSNEQVEEIILKWFAR